MTDLRVLSVRQPWAWAIIQGGKRVENRPRNVAGEYRGLVAIHASLTYSDVSLVDEPQLKAAMDRHASEDPVGEFDTPPWWLLGSVVGVVDLYGVHHSDDCLAYGALETCSGWAEVGKVHLELREPRPLVDPFPFRGALHLQKPSEADAAEILRRVR